VQKCGGSKGKTCTGIILSLLDDNETHLMLETNPTRL